MIIKKMLQAIILPMLLLMSMAAWSQQGNKVTGKVTDANGKPLEGVSVMVKGGKSGTSTDANGNFVINAAPDAKLVFTSVNFVAQEVAANAAGVNVSLAAAANDLNTVVVIGYGSARKKDLTGAVSTVTAKDFQKGNITTPEQMIAGKVAGVSIISNGGRPGAGSSISIRGGSSLNASNDPLIVIDGVPLQEAGNDDKKTKLAGAASPLSLINPNDIESYTVLKDASAAAIYGSRANNGVIIITTKKGKKGGLKVNFSSVNSASKITKKNKVLTGDDIRTIVKANGSAGNIAQLGTANTDWQDEIFQTGMGSDNNISLSGGIKNLPYRLSMGYFDQTGILKTDRLKKTSVSLALNPTFLDNHLKVDISLKGVSQSTRFAPDGAVGGAVGFDPTQPVYSSKPAKYGGYQEWTEANGDLVLNRANNPLGQLEQTFDEQKPMRLIGNAQVDYKFHFLPELRINANLAYDISKNTGTKVIAEDAAEKFVTNSGKGSYQQGKQTKRNTVLDLYLNYAKDFKSIKSRIDVTVGTSYNDFYTKNYNFRELYRNGDTILNSKPVTFAYDIPQNRIFSYFGRLLYNYDSRFFLTASMRRDQSSRFAKEFRTGYFPSVGVAWSLKGENFLANSKTISDLKLRVGYGLTGQQEGINNYDYQTRYSLGGQTEAYQFGNEFVQYYGPQGFNGGLKWEELSSYNAAVDFGFLNGRISGSVDFYIRKTKDMLSLTPQATGTNFTSFINANIGNMENKGVEMTLNLQPVRQKDWSWDIGMNATYNKNRITNLSVIKGQSSDGLPDPNSKIDGGNDLAELHQVGYSRSTFYLYQQVYGKDGNPIEGLFEDRNRDGQINSDDRYLGKPSVADWLFGFSTNVSYKKFSLGTVLRASLDNYVYNNIFSNRGRLNQMAGNYILGNGSANYLDTKFVGTTDKQISSDYYVQNGSFLRMDNLNIGYNVGRIMKNAVNLRITGSVQNVFVVTKYKGLDPETSTGMDKNLYPRPRTFALSFNLDF